MLLGASQDTLTQNRRMMAKACADANIELHKEKRTKDAHDKHNERTKDSNDFKKFTQSKQLKWNVPDTTGSM